MIKFVSEAFTLQDDNTCDGKISPADEPVVKAQYLRCMKEETDFYWEKKNQQQAIIILTRNIVHLCIDFVAVKDVHNILRSDCNINQEK